MMREGSVVFPTTAREVEGGSGMFTCPWGKEETVVRISRTKM